MPSETTTKEKIIAILFTLFLFLLVGGLLFFVSLKNKQRTEILQAKIAEQQKQKEILANLEKVQSDGLPLPELTSKSFLTLAIADNGITKIIFQKNPDLALPIASVTKLMVAVITIENMDLQTEVVATLDYIGKEESAYVLEANKTYKVKDLLANALIPSDNDSARLLSSVLGQDNFIGKMNSKAKEIGMMQTNYANVTGLDPAVSGDRLNTSTVTDLAKLLIYIKNKHPEILAITTKPEYNFCDTENLCKKVVSTDKLLGDENFKFRIIGGKTGSTDLAGKNLALMTEALDHVLLVNIVLGSKDNFDDTVSLINHIKIQN